MKKPSLDAESFKNYRPVSNLNFLSKVLEKVVASQLMGHIRRNGLQTSFQSAYRDGHSVETALLRVHNDIARAIGARKCVLLVLLDLSAAFDTVDHDILLRRLEKMGVQGTVLAWLRSYLTGRTQYAQIGSGCSPPIPVPCGVPQGSVLGPILFTLYTNPLGSILSSDDPDSGFHLYADDTQDYMAFEISNTLSTAESISNSVTSVSQWLVHNRLLCNNDKTEFLCITSKYMRTVPSIPTIKIVDCLVSPTDCARNLGVVFDKHLSLRQHISATVRCANIGIRNIGRIRKYLSTDTARLYTQLLIMSRLDFCNSLLIGLPAAAISPLQRVQNSAARLVTRTRKSVHITPILRDLHWLPVSQRIQFKVLVLVFKALHHLAPEYLCELVSARGQSRVLRSSGSVRLHMPKTCIPTYGDRAFSVAGPMLWNQLPTGLTSCTDLTTFKALLKTHLFGRVFDHL